MGSLTTASILMDFPIGYFTFYFGLHGSLVIGLLIVTYLEAAIFYGFRGGSWQRALRHSFWINVASSFLGYVTSFALHIFNQRVNYLTLSLRPDPYGSSEVWTEWMLFDENIISGIPTPVIFLLLSFLISILCEGLLYERLAKPLPQNDSWTLVIIANVASYALLFSVYLWWQILPRLFEYTLGLMMAWPLTLLLLIWLIPGLKDVVWRGLNSPWKLSFFIGLVWPLFIGWSSSIGIGGGLLSWIINLPLSLARLALRLFYPGSYARYPGSKFLLMFSIPLALAPWTCWRLYHRYRRQPEAVAVRVPPEPHQVVPLKEPPATGPLP